MLSVLRLTVGFYRLVKMNALARDGKWNPELERAA
jgi:hypothetical protein